MVGTSFYRFRIILVYQQQLVLSEGFRNSADSPVTMEPGVTAEDDHIVIGDCLTKDEAEDIIHVLVKDGAVQDLLADAQMRWAGTQCQYSAAK